MFDPVKYGNVSDSMGLTASDHDSNPKIPKCHRSDHTLPSELSKRVLDILYSREYRSRFPSFILGARKEKGKRRKVKGNQRQNAKVRGMHTGGAHYAMPVHDKLLGYSTWFITY